jgi:hypothetical protein
VVRVEGPRSICEMVDRGPQPERAREVAGIRARAGIESYLAGATAIPSERAAGIATALRRGVDDACRLGISTNVRLYLDALERPPRLPVYRAGLTAVEVSAVRQPIAEAIPGIVGVYRSEDATLEVNLALDVTRDPERHVGALDVEAIGAELTVTIRDVRGSSDVAVLHHTLALPADAEPPAPGPWPEGAGSRTPEWEDGNQPYTWMVERLIVMAGALARADVGLPARAPSAPTERP